MLYTATEIARMVGVTSQTIKEWEKSLLIPKAGRVQRRRKRVWSEGGVRQILKFAQGIGYNLTDRLLPPELRSSSGENQNESQS